MLNAGASRGNETVGRSEALKRTEQRLGIRCHIAVHLVAIEDKGCTRHTALAIVGGIIGVRVGFIFLVEDDERRLFTLAHLAVEFAPLLVGCPSGAA